MLCDRACDNCNNDDKIATEATPEPETILDPETTLELEETPEPICKEVSYCQEQPVGKGGWRYHQRSIAEQVEILQSYFPRLSFVGLDEAMEIPDGAEGPFVILKWQSVAPTYNRAFQKVIKMILRKNYKNICQKDECSVRQDPDTAKMIDEISANQARDAFILPAQWSDQRYHGLSARKALKQFLPNEFGLDSFSVACMLLTHPERISHFWVAIYATGGVIQKKVSPTTRGLDCAPLFSYALQFDSVSFCHSWVELRNDSTTTATGFIPLEFVYPAGMDFLGVPMEGGTR
ncbi:MAG: hypothetical protein WC268_00595 [Patescibacteria group bacterium]